MSLLSLLGNFFAEKALVTPYILENSNKIKTTVLLNIKATRYFFVDPSIVCRICDKLLVEPIKLLRPKAIQDFDGKKAPDVTHAIYSTMIVQDHSQLIILMLITKLDQH